MEVATGKELLEQLYFGSVPVYFAKVEGKAFAYTAASFVESDDPELRKLSIDRIKPAGFLGEEYNNLILPAIAAVDLKEGKIEPDNSALPAVFRTPLLKVVQEKGEYEGVQSGRRSALIKVEGKWYRLKGCGDLTEGFPLQKVPDTEWKDPVQIRGAMFSHTSARELYYSGLLDAALKEINVSCTNTPVGWWEYNLPDTLYSKVVRTCGIFECKGEKRLADHVLVGLERSLPILLGNRFDAQTLLPRFDEIRRQEPGAVTETWLVVLTEGDFGTCADISDYPLDHLILTEPITTDPQALGVNEIFRGLWEQNCRALRAELDAKKEQGSGIGNLYAYLYWRLGREAGVVQRTLRKNDLSWGTYVDPLGTHCNAHPNNLVLLPEDEHSDVFLAPLDFDMAFSKKTFNQEMSLYDTWMVLEDRSLKLALAGDEALNSGVRGCAVLDDNFKILKWGLRDTMVKGFVSGYEDQEDTHPFDRGVARAAHALLRLALMLTSKDIA